MGVDVHDRGFTDARDVRPPESGGARPAEMIEPRWLALGVIEQAIRDAALVNRGVLHEEAAAFLDGGDVEPWCWLAGLAPDALRRALSRRLATLRARRASRKVQQ
jgi:hypothetical protein